MKRMNNNIKINSISLKIMLFLLIMFGSSFYVLALGIDDYNDHRTCTPYQRYAIYGFDSVVANYNSIGSEAEFDNISSYLFKPSKDFTEGDMRNIVKATVDPAELASDYYNPDIDPSLPIGGFNKAYLDCGIYYTDSYEDVFRAGVYAYGSVRAVDLTLESTGTYKKDGTSWGCDSWCIFPGGSEVCNWDCGTTERRVPYAYVAVQGYKLFDGYGVDKISAIMASHQAPAADLTAYALWNPVHIKQADDIDTGSWDPVTKSAYISNNGVTYIAIAGGHDSRNANWADRYLLRIDTKATGEFVLSVRPLSYSEIRSSFTRNYFESNVAMCNLVGQHISSLGFSGESNRIKCCGGNSTDIGKPNLQYVCRRNATTDKYYWESVCNKNWPVGSFEYNLNATFCSPCTDYTTGKCGGTLSLTCNGTYTCSRNYNEGDCESVSGCQWEYDRVLYCPPSDDDGPIRYDTYDADVVTRSEPLPVRGEQFGTLLPDGCYYIDDTDSGSCQATSGIDTPRSCNYVSLSTCKDINGCSLRDSYGSSHDLTDTCAIYSYNMNECNLRDNCDWTCKGDIGETCNTNADCKILGGNQLQCDTDFEGVKRCHTTDDRCVFDNSGSENDLNQYVCSNNQYKRCYAATDASITYTDYCTTTQGFACAGTPVTKRCEGVIDCADYDGGCPTALGCSYTRTMQCTGTYYGCTMYAPLDDDGTCASLKGSEAITRDVGETGESFGATVASNRLVSESFADQVGDCCLTYGQVPCGGISQSECGVGEYNSCDWAYGPYYCTGRVDCADEFTVATCPRPACSVFPYFSTCTGVPYANCTAYSVLGTYPATGCSRSCILPRFSAPVNLTQISSDDTVSVEACRCGGKDVVDCYVDYDGDGYPLYPSTPVKRCTLGENSLEYKGYICNYTGGVGDCNDNDPTNNPGFGSTPMVHISDSADLRAACACTQREGYNCYVDYDDDGVPGKNPFSFACVRGSNVEDYIDNITHNTYVRYNVSYVCNYTGAAFDCDDSNSSLIDDCPSPCTGFITYEQRIGFIGENPNNTIYYVPPKPAPIIYTCNGSGMNDVVSNDVAAVNDGVNILMTYESPLLNDSDMLPDLMFFNTKVLSSGYNYPVCAESTSVDRFCIQQGYDAGNVRIISTIPENCISWSGTAWTQGTGQVGNINCTFLPVCNNGPSITQYCNEKGYDAGMNAGAPTTNRCIYWTGSSWGINNTGRVNPISCYYYTNGEFDKIAFTLDGKTYGATRCVRDGLCMDDFTTTDTCGLAAPRNYSNPSLPNIGPICGDPVSVAKFCDLAGFTAGGASLGSTDSNYCWRWSGTAWTSTTDDLSTLLRCNNHTDPALHLDPDCGEHIWMKNGYVSIKQGVLDVPVYPFNFTIPARHHKECVDVTDCIVNTSNNTYLCVDQGAVYDTGVVAWTDPMRLTTIKVNCSIANTWCPKGYTWVPPMSRCMFVAGEDCAITECTQAVNFTVYDEGVLINRMYFVNDSIATAVNILGGGALTKEYYLQYRDRFFNDTDCYRKNSTNSKITTVCGVKLTFPEFRYEYKNVTVK